MAENKTRHLPPNAALAQARYVRMTPMKCRRVIDLVRGTCQVFSMVGQRQRTLHPGLVCRRVHHSHSIVAGGLPLMS